MDSLASISPQINNNYNLELESSKNHELELQNNGSEITDIVLPILMTIGCVFTLIGSAAAASAGLSVLSIVMGVASVACLAIGLAGLGSDSIIVRREVNLHPVVRLSPGYRHRRYNQIPRRERNVVIVPESPLRFHSDTPNVTNLRGPANRGNRRTGRVQGTNAPNVTNLRQAGNSGGRRSGRPDQSNRPVRRRLV